VSGTLGAYLSENQPSISAMAMLFPSIPICHHARRCSSSLAASDVSNVSNISGNLLRPSWEFTVVNKTFFWPSSRDEKPSRQRRKTH
jgi:hypothetical protein